MKLKSISIHGFKSFADRVNVQYHDGITGVIGPNGSGKSNIIDAIRWVMGEQTAKSLRADDPTDIIFAGSQTRKPLGMAEVTLTFTNTGQGCPPELLHLPEISIGRRIYRDGEREYFFNKQNCRLKDIVEFLLGIGLGSKSYSIIQQDQRDRIIKASPDDMREILEETAGISAFKTHRKDAEKRLSSTGDKLKSLSEIENELIKQSESLKEQVEKAQLKQKLVSELREKEVELLADQIHFYRDIANKISAELEARSKEEEKSVVDSSEWEARANNLKATQIELATSIKTLENEFDDRRMRLATLKQKEQSQRERNDERARQKMDLTKELADERQNLQREEERLASSLKELENSESEFRRLDGELETLMMRLEEVDEGMQVERVRGEELRSEIRALQDLLASLRVKNETVLQTLEKTGNAIHRNEEHLAEAQRQRTQLVADRRDIEVQLSSLSQGLESVASEKSQLDLQVLELEKMQTEAQAKRDDAKAQYVEINGLYSSLQKLISQNEGLSDGARMLREKLSGKIKGFLFENVTVHKDDEVLLERALPELLQAAVVEDTEVLMDLLDKAEEMGSTKVGFVVSELIPALSDAENKAKQGILAIPGLRCVGARGDTSQPALRNLLDRIFIARDEWLLLKAHRQFGATSNGFIFVSERGTVLSGARELSYGETKEGQGQGLLQRKRELYELEKRREQMQGELAATEGQVVQFASRKKEVTERVQQIDSKLSTEKFEVQKLSGSLDNFDLQIKHVDDNIRRLEEDLKELTEERDAARASFASHQGQIDKAEGERARYQRELDDFEAEFNEKKELRETLVTQINSKKSERSVLQERQSNSRRNYEEGMLYVQRTRAKVDRNIALISELENQITNADAEEQTMEKDIKRLHQDVLYFQQELETKVTQEAEIAEELRVIENRLKNQKDADLKRQKYISERSVELERARVILGTAEKDLWERFQLTPAELPPARDADPQRNTKLEREIQKLQNKVNELGAVNELALDEYHAVEERRQFLLSQKADIENSILELQKAISEIEETTKTRFKEIFDVVDKEFRGLFPVLFPNGSAELHMLNPDDLLNTGVEILVQLPGKRQQNMSLFSGGEKALTAISLIFALLKTRPAPFCFLDEVDAPLDEANVGRFNAVLEALSDQFQFVVITHNRRTMEVLDTIYGISMAEPGVSKLVSVDLSEVPSHLRKKETVRPISSAPERVGATSAQQ